MPINPSTLYTLRRLAARGIHGETRDEAGEHLRSLILAAPIGEAACAIYGPGRDARALRKWWEAQS